MLVSFSVANFRSFCEEQTFSMVASGRLGAAHESHAIPIPGSGEKVLRSGVLYGANGAGKSNLLAALRYAQRVALGMPTESGIGRTPFRASAQREQPSTFDVQFLSCGNLYRFGFSVDDDKIIEEWLVHVAGTKEKTIYERSTDANRRVEIDAIGLTDASKKLEALVTVGGRHNQSFLATVRANLEPQDFGIHLSAAVEWMARSLTLIKPATKPKLLSQYLASNDEFREFAGGFLKASGTGVDQLKVNKVEIPEEEARSLVPDSTLAKAIDQADHEQSVALHLRNGRELLIEHAIDGVHFYRVVIQTAHQHSTEETHFELAEESDGTRRLLDLLPALYLLRENSNVYVIDEIDRSMHPMLVYKFLQYFLTVCTQTPCQVIMTTHESHLLDLNLLRRDEIWFAEKNAAGATHLYSLTDFNVRKDLQIEKGYFEGRFGAVPFLGDIDRLMQGASGGSSCP